MEEQIRWKQRLENYRKALKNLDSAVSLSNERELSDLEKQGMVQAFEFTHELSWKLLKDFLEEQGDTGILGSKDATRRAFNRGIIFDGEVWMDMIKSRNLSSHTYDEDTAEEICEKITSEYTALFKALEEKLSEYE